MNFREAQGKQLLWKDTGLETGFSNFLFIEQNYDSDPVMRRVFSLARKHNYQSVLIDDIEESNCVLLQQENEALHICKPDFEKSVVHRISFFRTPSGQQPAETDFLGYVVFKQDYFKNKPQPRTHIYESVTLPCRTKGQNNFVHCARDFGVNTSLGKFRVSGVLYAQQNDSTFVCAHVALRSALAAILPQGDITYPEMNALLNIDHKTRMVGNGSGLGPEEIETVFNHYGIDYDKFLHEPREKLYLLTDFQRDLYGIIESGFPALVGFELDEPKPRRHVIPVFGHTFNEDAWLPDAQRTYFGSKLSYYPSENWLSTFVVHDDNFGPYFCLPRHFLKADNLRAVPNGLKWLAGMLKRHICGKDNFRLMYGLKSKPTVFGAVDAEAAGFDLFMKVSGKMPPLGLDWYDRFTVFTRCGWLVLRTILLRRDDYLGHVKAIKDRAGVPLEEQHIEKLRSTLPDTFWMIEASAPELFAVSREKFGEVLLVTDKPKSSPLFSLVLSVRLPGVILFGGGDELNVEKTKLEGHTPIFTFAPQ
jgi:hypothetical protein